MKMELWFQDLSGPSPLVKIDQGDDGRKEGEGEGGMVWFRYKQKAIAPSPQISVSTTMRNIQSTEFFFPNLIPLRDAEEESRV